MIAHQDGLMNPVWPLCFEAEAQARGWSAEEIRNGEVSDFAGFGSVPLGDVLVDCVDCIEWLHA